MRALVAAVFASVVAGCSNPLCGPDLAPCRDGFSVDVATSSGRSFDTGDWSFVVDADVGTATLRCAVTNAFDCKLDAGATANVDVGSTWQGNALYQVFVTVYGRPQRVSLRVEHAGKSLGEHTFDKPAYVSVPGGCGGSCAVASDQLLVAE